jgi:uncharacterized protein (TIGR00290 family)
LLDVGQKPSEIKDPRSKILNEVEMKEKVLFSWSGGKDSAFALHDVLQVGEYEIAALLTTVTRDYDRISMHGVRNNLLEEQAARLGLPIERIYLSKESSNEEYEAGMKAMLLRYRQIGITKVVFGDIYLEDLRKYREDKLAQIQMTAIFPLWKQDTSVLARRFICLGFKAVLTCVDSKFLGPEFAGLEFDETLLTQLSPGVDPCGENGEFHTFVYAAPIFNQPIPLTRGEIVLRNERFWYCDFDLMQIA